MSTMDLAGFTDADATRTIVRALRLLGVMTVIAAPLVAWKMGWQSGALLAVGAAISAAGLWKWLRLMTLLVARMEVPGANGGTTADTPEAEGKRPAAMGSVLLGFFLTLGLMMAALYGSLKALDGSVYALFAGLGMGIVALTVEALRLVKAWTV
jgi:hypothetical protein